MFALRVIQTGCGRFFENFLIALQNRTLRLLLGRNDKSWCTCAKHSRSSRARKCAAPLFCVCTTPPSRAHALSVHPKIGGGNLLWRQVVPNAAARVTAPPCTRAILHSLPTHRAARRIACTHRGHKSPALVFAARDTRAVRYRV